METLKINYKKNTSELCLLGKKYDTDKSSQRDNVTDHRHCHPYTLFYDGMFKNKKNESLKIAELGILEGASLLMWKEYFANSEIYGFEYNHELIDRFKTNFNNERIILNSINVKNNDSITTAFSDVNVMYDIIIEDTTHEFEDQIRVIENIYQYLKPGGILIIEDIFKSYNEDDYINRLNPILHNFKDYYFIELDHDNRNSTGWDNDKLFILIKSGDKDIFDNKNKITIITPSIRVENLLTIKNSINFDYVEKWIIVYDENCITENPNIFKTECNIEEYIHKDKGISGNPQRNYALSKITNPSTLIYYLDDDNIIHPNIYRLLNMIDNTKIYTFNQLDAFNQLDRIKGNNININMIDTAMFIIPFILCKNVKWLVDLYNADGFFIKECYDNDLNSHIFVDNNLCYYNYITWTKK